MLLGLVVKYELQKQKRNMKGRCKEEKEYIRKGIRELISQ